MWAPKLAKGTGISSCCLQAFCWCRNKLHSLTIIIIQHHTASIFITVTSESRKITINSWFQSCTLHMDFQSLFVAFLCKFTQIILAILIHKLPVLSFTHWWTFFQHLCFFHYFKYKEKFPTLYTGSLCPSSSSSLPEARELESPAQLLPWLRSSGHRSRMLFLESAGTQSPSLGVTPLSVQITAGTTVPPLCI